jgi:hypothetical protein
MQELKWLEVLPQQSLEAGLAMLNELKWNIQVREVEGIWFVNTGHQVILKTSSRDSVDALLYGLAISFSVLPKSALNEFRKFMMESAGIDERGSNPK